MADADAELTAADFEAVAFSSELSAALSLVFAAAALSAAAD